VKQREQREQRELGKQCRDVACYVWKLGEKRRSDETSFVGAGFTTNISFSP